MKPVSIFGILLIIVGIAVLIYGGVWFTEKKDHNIGPIYIQTHETHTFPVSPIIGIVAIVGGAFLTFQGARKSV